MKKRLMGFLGLAVSILSLAIFASSCSKSSDPNGQLNKELSDIQAYLTLTNSQYYDIFYSNTPVALVNPGTGGPLPLSDQTVNAAYTISLLSDGTIVKKDTLKNQAVSSITEQGLAAVLIMPEGSTAQVFVPSQYAYGSSGNASLGVPPNATLIYNIQLLQVNKTAAEATQLLIDQQRIQRYLDSLKIQATQLPGGVWFQTVSPGTGDYPKLYDYVSFHYNGIVMSNGVSFQSGDITSTPVLQFIEGLRQGLPYMADGGSTTFYIPSVYAYGTNKDSNGNIITAGIPSNACLIFQVQLNGINQ